MLKIKNREVSKVIDNSDKSVKRMRLIYKSGYSLLIILTPGSSEELFEISIFDPQGVFYKLAGWQSNVLSQLTREEVYAYVDLVSRL